MIGSQRLQMGQILNEYPEARELSEGQQIKRVHHGCDAGSTKSAKLYLTGTETGVIGHCFRCNAGGGIGLRQENFIRKRANNVVDEVALVLPADLKIGLVDCHPLMNVWLAKAGITQEEREQHAIGWSESRKRAILPIFMHGKLVAYQERRLLPNDTGPKYLTTRLRSVKHPLFQVGPSYHGGTMVIVEDILSAIKVGRVANATALLGVYLPDESTRYVIRLKPDEVLVMLDNDNPQVRVQQRKVLRRLGAFVTTRRVFVDGRDPKLMSEEELIALFNIKS
jgi:hypothetical protein